MAIEDEMKDVQQLVVNQLGVANGLDNSIADGQVTPAKLSTGAPDWTTAGDFRVNGHNIEIGHNLVGEDYALIDFHSTSASNPDYDARIIKYLGEDSNLDIINKGSGETKIIQGGETSFRATGDETVGRRTVISAGTAGTGAHIELYGDTYTGAPSEAFYDAAEHNFRTEAGTLRVTIDNLGDITSYRHIRSGFEGTGQASLTTNDGHGNTNVAFNHTNGTPDVDGSSGRITCPVESTTAQMQFQIKSNMTVAGGSQALDSVLTLSEGTSVINRADGSAGEILNFNVGGTQKGRIGSNEANLYIGAGSANLKFGTTAVAIIPCDSSGNNQDNAIDLGAATTGRFQDIHATNGTIQTSDINEKQDIAELDAAEQAVAVAVKGLLRKFRWKSAVEEKGDDARIHVGIMAQDLQAAFAAEGLDAGRYGMFISNTWWEKERVVPAVEEELDEEGNVITEAQESYTTTDVWDTEEEADEDAVSKTRLGVRYSELLAFIISAI